MAKSDRKQKYHQWELEDGLTLQEKRFRLRRYLTRIYKRYIPESEVNRILNQLENKTRTGYIR